MNTEICCDKCFRHMNNINLWHNNIEKLLYFNANSTHNVYKHKSKDYYIICQIVFNKKNRLIAFHYAQKMKIIYCVNCLKDSISFHNILDNYYHYFLFSYTSGYYIDNEWGDLLLI
jgi:hypothetical protein